MLPALPAGMEQRGGDPSLQRDELLHIISAHIDRHPRSLQKAIGPSELGTPCTRRLAYKMLDLPETNPRPGAWKPTVGTAVHTWLEGAMAAHNDSHVTDRFYLEERVTVGQVGGVDVSGCSDCYDRITATVIDWKVVGLAGLKRYRIDGPGEQYRRQAHLYGRGFVAAGQPVDRVGIVFLPQNGELTDCHYWSEPYDETLAVETLTRANAVHDLVSKAGVHALPLLPTYDAYCTFCPFHATGSTDLAAGCPGDAGADLRIRTSKPLGLEDLSGLVA